MSHQKKINILYIIPSLEVGGAENQLNALIGGLKKKNYKVDVCCLYRKGPFADEIRDKTDSIFCLCLRNIWDIRGFWRMWRLIGRSHYDIVHAYMFDSSLFSVLPARLAKVSIVITSRRNYDDWMRWYHLLLQRILNLWTDKILVNSKKVAQLVIDQEKVLPEKVMVIYNGINYGKFNIALNQAEVLRIRADFGLTDKDLVIAMIGNFKRSKGYLYLLRSASNIINKFPNVKFVLVGEGPLKLSIEEAAKKMGLENKIVFIGRRMDIPQLLSVVDVGVLSSIREGLSNALLEYMAAGRPAVVTNVGGNAEVVIHNVTGILVPKRDSSSLAEAINKLLLDHKMRIRMGMNAKNRVEKCFSLDMMIDNHCHVYKSLVSRN